MAVTVAIASGAERTLKRWNASTMNANASMKIGKKMSAPNWTAIDARYNEDGSIDVTLVCIETAIVVRIKPAVLAALQLPAKKRKR